MAVWRNGVVSARCPDCNSALAAYQQHGGGSIEIANAVEFQTHTYNRTVYYFMRCGGCGRGGLSKILDQPTNIRGTPPPNAVCVEFFPVAVEHLPIPEDVPEGVKKEFQEAELCAAYGGYRAASALLRSVLEKTLKANGYTKGTLEAKIDEAAKDGALTQARRTRAHENIRDLGNDVVHDDWREVTEAEYLDARKYAQRILEDFYDDPKTVEAELKKKRDLTTVVPSAEPAGS